MTSDVASPMTALSAAIERLSDRAPHWGSKRIVDEGLDIIRDYCWAGSSAIYGFRGGRITMIGHRPEVGTPGDFEVRGDWFPWGLAPMNPRRFMFIENARLLPAAPDSTVTLGELGVESCVHLPLLERDRPRGYLQVFWPETRLVWDDEMGRVLRTLGRLLLESSSPPD